MLTAKEEPERPPPYFTLDEIEAIIRGLFVQPQRNRDVSRLTECGVLGSVMALTEMVYRVAISMVR